MGLAERDSMPEENILMKPVVLAKNDPAIIAVLPHPHLRLKAIWLVVKQALDQTSHPVSALSLIKSLKLRFSVRGRSTQVGRVQLHFCSRTHPVPQNQIESKPTIEAEVVG
jgi:hypothetical protein